MTNYYTLASVVFAEGLTGKELVWFNREMCMVPEGMTEEELQEWAEERGISDPDYWTGSFKAEVEGDARIWIHHEESISIDNAVEFVQYFLRIHRPNETVNLEWSHYCDAPRLDGFGGGVVHITAEKAYWMNTCDYADNFKEIIRTLNNLDAAVPKGHAVRKHVDSLLRTLPGWRRQEH